MTPVDVAAPPSLWHNRGFRSLWAAQGISQFGDRITELALPLIAVVVLHASPNEVALITAAVWLPNLLALFLGAWVDHQPVSYTHLTLPTKRIV